MSTAQSAAKVLKPEQYITLLELSKARAAHRDLSGLFHDLACRLQTLFNFRDLGVMLHDSSRNVMRLHLLETCAPTKWKTPTEVPMEGSIAGWVWQNQPPVVVRDITLQDRFPIAKTLLDHPSKAIS